LGLHCYPEIGSENHGFLIDIEPLRQFRSNLAIWFSTNLTSCMNCVCHQPTSNVWLTREQLFNKGLPKHGESRTEKTRQTCGQGCKAGSSSCRREDKQNC
jgi:hypothetical protein